MKTKCKFLVEENKDILTYDNLESTVINVLSKGTNVYVTTDGIEACHRIDKFKGNSNKSIVRLINRKHYKCALVNRKTLKSFNSEIIGLPNAKLFINENLTEYSTTLALYGSKLKRSSLINSDYAINDTVHILRSAGESPINVFHASKLLELYPNFKLSNPTMMVMSLLMLLVIPQFNQTIKVL